MQKWRILKAYTLNQKKKGIHKNIDKIPDAVIGKYEEDANFFGEKQIYQITNTKDKIEINVHKEKTESEKLETISVTVLKDQYQETVSETEATKSCNLTNDDELNNINFEKTDTRSLESAQYQ